MTNALWLDNLDIIRFEDVKRRRIFSIYRHGMARRREGFRAYICSEVFLTASNGLDPERRQSAMRAYARAELCVKRKHLTV